MKYTYTLLLGSVLSIILGCATDSDTLPLNFDIDKGYPETFFTPQTPCWVQPSGSSDWFVCGHAPGQKEQLEQEMRQGHSHTGAHEL